MTDRDSDPLTNDAFLPLGDAPDFRIHEDHQEIAQHIRRPSRWPTSFSIGVSLPNAFRPGGSDPPCVLRQLVGND